MSMTPPAVRFGVVGVGTMGAAHARWLLDGKVPRARLTALADPDPARLAPFAAEAGVARFADAGQMIRSGAVDAVLIATPHYDHVAVGIDALANGLHVLVEKPLAVHKADCERMLAAYARRPDQRQRFGVMFNLRTIARFAKLKALIDAGELGAIRRVNWIITDCFRTEAYYASGGWRATWRGEGGGVLVNQCPHHLDLLQWLFGMPVAVHARCRFGAAHAIEVEDEVTAQLEFADGASGVFVASTGEAPGTDRLEVAAERGRVVIEDQRLTWLRNTVPMGEFSRTTPERFARPECWKVEVPVAPGGGEHITITTNFVAAILDGAPLIAPASDGIRSVELANAMIQSSLTERTVRLPLDGAEYQRQLERLIAGSKPLTSGSAPTTAPTKASPGAGNDLAASFKR